MIYDNIEFHNIEELKEITGKKGRRLQRIPDKVRLLLNEGAQERMLDGAGSEIRFVTNSDTIKIELTCESECEIIPFWGMFQGDPLPIKGKETIKLTYPERLSNFNLDSEKEMPFSKNCWRLMLRGGPIYYEGIEGKDLRPPQESEHPDTRYLAYGTSITHGAASTGMHLAYVSQTARRLGVDLINLGVGGSAYCEPELADYIAHRDDWDFATLSLSVNMVGGFSESEFKDRVSYMVNRIGKSSRPVFGITIFPYFNDFEGADGEDKKKVKNFRKILKEEIKNSNQDNLHLIAGKEILKDIGGLSPDLIHPADNGMIQMGENLARRIDKVLRTR